MVFETLRESTHWRNISGLTVYAERITDGADDDLLRISTVMGGELNSCTLTRTLDAGNGTIYFQQTDPIEPLLAFGGEWTVAEGEVGTIVTIQHDFDVDGGADASSWLLQTIDEGNRWELDALKLTAEWLAGLLRTHEGASAIPD
ncbi:SRPBCC family protein [Pseudarthrobacter sp. P1]|uniref:SRPBCC family protein n=1 Tax=Pseudarthrobacter sp. P1 TaxID=3418418 RepID=UPI003CE6B1C2